MTCDGKVYAATDVDINMSICDSSIAIQDIASMSITFTNNYTGSTVIITSTNGGITILNTITAHVLETHITNPGVYGVKVSIVDSSGGNRGLTPNPDFIVFN